MSISALVLLAAVGFSPALAHDATGRYVQTNLVSDQPGVAQLFDANLVNAWGISFSATSPFWVSDNGTGVSTIYQVTNDASGMPQISKLGLEVSIPGEGNPTGQVFNNTSGFNGDLFIFASEDGTISGWRPALGTSSEVLTNMADSVYKGVTLSGNASHPLLLAANFSQGTVDVFEGDMNLLGQFKDGKAPAGYAPFNVQSLHGIVFVTFAKQDDEKHDDLSGAGHGLIDIFNPKTGKFRRFATGSDAGGKLQQINSPWGLAVAPKHFGSHGDQLLVGNFGNGTIMAFEVDGAFRGLLQDSSAAPLFIEGLWGLTFGNGTRAGDANTLYFSAGPGGEGHGLFGALLPARKQHHDHDGDGDDD